VAALNQGVGCVTLHDILAIEDDPEILSFRCPETGFLAWPTVRHVFLSYLINELAYEWRALIGPRPALWQHRAALTALGRCISHNRLARRRGITRRAIMIFATTGTIVPQGGRAFNRVSDHFALATPAQSCCYEDVSPLQYEVPRNRANRDVLYTLPALAGRYLASAFRRGDKFDRVAHYLTHFLARRAERMLGLKVSAERRAMTRAFVARGLSRYPFERHRYEGLFAEGRPRILLVTSGTQGSLAVAIQVAHAMGIPVAEYQHGQTGSGQPEYNFAATLRDSEEYRTTLPDYLLSYGRWWTERINAPVRPVVIGNPHRSEALARSQNAAASDRADILVVAKLGEAARYRLLASELHRCAGGRLKIRLRPNPRDRAFLPGAHSDGRIGPILIDRNPDFYESLAWADTVVSGPSTTLAEALGVAKRIFIWDEAGATFKYPEPVFEQFTTAAELIDKLDAGPDASRDRPSPDDFWASDWRSRYRSFIAPFLPSW
jgi:hypothetical protein